MSIAQSLLAEFENELKTTRRFLEAIPKEKLAWRPHEKSMSAGQLGLHIAQVPMGVLSMAMEDVGSVPDMSKPREEATSIADMATALERNAAYVRATLPTIDDARMMCPVKFMRGEQVVMEVSRVGFLRSIMFNHLYHHRGQLGVYLRLLGVKVPSSYGPSADESPF